VAAVSGDERRSALYVGSVSHRRHRPRPNAFRYGLYWTLIDVDELAALDREVRGFGYRRRAVTSFHDTDHFGPADVPVRVKLARWLADRGVELPPGRVEVLTSLRVLGYVFNPVSWWFCHDADGELALVVAEVNNTFGDAHSYLFDRLERHRDGTLRAAAPKAFHVSPFLPIDGHTYEVVLLPPGERVLVKMDVREVAPPGAEEDAELILDATQDGRRVPLNAPNLARTLARFPLVTLRTVFLIHRQAWRLWRLRTPFFRRPVAPDDGYGRLDQPRRSPPAERTILPGAVAEHLPTAQEIAS
jgi:DUF1365 family protein